MPKSTAVSPRAKRLWQRLIEWYGTRLIEQYGEKPPPDWIEVVDNADNDLVRRGLTIIRTKYVAHPPTFPQFAEALAPVKAAKGARQTSVAEKLYAYVTRSYGDMLTAKQLLGPWTYIGKMFPAQDLTGATTENHGVDITGVVIDADGDSPGYRVTVLDMEAAAIDWGHPQAPASHEMAQTS